ncbi:MAG: hypothetical protein AB1568_17445 [Thermodesulfobacteriota bacterium]
MQEANQGLLLIAVIVAATAALLHLAGPSSRQEAAAAAPPAAKTTARPQTVCPVMGGKIDENLYVDVKGKRIYLCCMACEDAIKVEPDKYIEKIEKRGEKVADIPDATGR